MIESYKPSMFNHHTSSDDGMMIYNSLSGVHKILYVSPNHEQHVLDLLSTEEVMLDSTDSIMGKLIEYGYLVPKEKDEIAVRQKIHNDIITDSTLNLVIHTTTACNFRCKYCYMDFGSGSMSRAVQDHIIQFIRYNITNATALHIVWFGGEPLLGLDAIQHISEQAIAICKSSKKMFTASITTNGYLLTPDVFKILRECRVTRFTITLDGLKDIHDQYRVLVNGGPTFQTIIDNLTYIRDNVKNNTIIVTIRNNITSKFINRIQEYVDYYSSLFAYDKRFKFLIRIVDDWGGDSVASIKDDIVTYSILGNVFREIAALKPKIDFSPSFSSLDKGGVSCDAMNSNKYTISATGIISKCDEAASANNNLGIGQLLNEAVVIDNDLHAKWLYCHLKHIHKCEKCFFSIPCLMNVCPKHTIETGNHACPLNLEEINGMIQLAGSQYRVETI